MARKINIRIGTGQTFEEDAQPLIGTELNGERVELYLNSHVVCKDDKVSIILITSVPIPDELAK